MKPLFLTFTFTFVCVALSTPLRAQTPAPAATAHDLPPFAKTASLAGPRFGFTFLSDSIVDKLHAEDISVKNGISQFGWQFERRFYSKQGGPTVLNEWVVLAG